MAPLLHNLVVSDAGSADDDVHRRANVPAWKRLTGRESRWAVSAVMVGMIAMQAGLPDALTPTGRWLLPVIELALLLVLLVLDSPRWSRQARLLRVLGLILAAVASIANGLALVMLITGLVRSYPSVEPPALLGAGAMIWLTNVIVFAVWFWELDRGGPDARARGVREHPDFCFPQMTSPELAPPGWEPAFLDYLYVSFTNATAFSPTDAMPMSRWAKSAMMLEEAISLVTAALVIARAVNVLS